MPEVTQHGWSSRSSHRSRTIRMSRRAVALPPLALVSLVLAQTAACVVSESIPGEPRLSSALELRLGEPWIANEDAIPRTGGLEERDDHSFGPGDYGWGESTNALRKEPFPPPLVSISNRAQYLSLSGTDVVTVTRTADSCVTPFPSCDDGARAWLTCARECAVPQLAMHCLRACHSTLMRQMPSSR